MNKQMVRPFMWAAVAASMISCSSNSQSEEQPTICEEDQFPMRFSSPAVGTMESRTRATTLTSGFLVSTYKDYGLDSQQEVMNQYEAQYQSDPWTATNTSWNTVGTTADGFYQTQYEKYWDLDTNPYEFFAIAPAPIENGALKAGFVVSDKKLTIGYPYTGQYAADGKVSSFNTAATEEYLVSQVERRRYDANPSQSEDTDRLTGTTISGNTTPTGKVPLPFHHLTSKVRFAIYTTEPVSENQTLPITGVSFKVKTTDGSDGFVKSVSGYTADMSSTSTAIQGSFTSPTHATDNVDLLTLTGPVVATEEKFPEAYLEKHEWESKTKTNAYFFECEDGLAQIPQGNVQILVSFTITPTTGDPLVYENVPLTIKDSDGNEVSTFTWEPNHLYTYYIVVGKLISHDISFTATVADWENVYGEINTNLED